MACDDYMAAAKAMGIDCSKFTPEEQEKISAKIAKLMDEGKTQDQAIAIAINMITPEKSRSENAQGGSPTPDATGDWPNERPEVTGSVNASRCSSWGDVKVCFGADDAPPAPVPVQVGQFRGELDEQAGRLILFDVPVFVTCKRGKNTFDASWLKDALADAKRGEADGYLPPMHVRHHRGVPDDDVEAAGMFRMKRIEGMSYKGNIVPSVISDLIYTNPRVIGEVLAGRMPYRSVEIFDVKSRKIDGLALLADEAPFLELPITANVDGSESVQPFTFSQPFDLSTVDDQGPVVAFFSRGAAVHILMESPMADDHSPSQYRPAVNFQKDDEDENATATAVDPSLDAGEPEESAQADTDGGESTPEETPAPEESGPDTSWMDGEADGPVDAKAVVTAILEGRIAVRDFHAIQQAIAEVESKAHPAGEASTEAEPTVEPEAETEPEEAAAAEENGETPPAADESAEVSDMEERRKREAPPAAAPGEALKREPTADAELLERLARAEAKSDANEQKLLKRDEDDAVRSDVDEAMTRLKGRYRGADPRGRLEAFRREHGGDAFKAYVDQLHESLPDPMFSRTDSASSADDFDFGRKVPDEVLAFQKDGPEAFAAARQHAGQYEELRRRNMTRVSLARYLEIQMAGVRSLAADQE